MNLNKSRGVSFLMVAAAILFVTTPVVLCQDQSARTATRDDEANLDTQLYLILATNREADEGKIPAPLEPIMKRLRETLPFRHYTVAGTFLNRVRNNGRLEVSWLVNGSPFILPTTNTSGGTLTPTFNTFGTLVKLATDANGNDIVRMNDLRFGAQVPVMSGQVTAFNPPSAQPSMSVNYQTIGLKTDISMREGAPVIAGTMSVGSQGDVLVVAVSAQRAK